MASLFQAWSSSGKNTLNYRGKFYNNVYCSLEDTKSSIAVVTVAVQQISYPFRLPNPDPSVTHLHPDPNPYHLAR